MANKTTPTHQRPHIVVPVYFCAAHAAQANCGAQQFDQPQPPFMPQWCQTVVEVQGVRTECGHQATHQHYFELLPTGTTTLYAASAKNDYN